MTGPQFVDNREGNTFAKTISEHLSELRNAGESPEELCIATGYFNAAGWLKVSKEIHHLNKVRLLIGAEPSLNQEMSFRRPGDPKEPTRTTKQVQEILKGQVLGLKKERDQGFDFNLEGFGQLQKLMDFFRSEKVEVRRHEKRFFHAKAWLLRGKNRGVLAGSSNLTAAGLQSNLELNLGHYQDPLLDQVESWYDEVWEDSEPFDLAEIYAALFNEFPPWIIYLRVLWELYGDELEEEEEELGHLTLTTFQKHGVWRARRILKELGGVVVADGVGLGKTFVAAGLMQDYRERRQRILLVRPAALEATWKNFLSDHYLGDVEAISYEKLAGHPQLGGDISGNLSRNLDEYQLVVIDEAHNYRNPNAPMRAGVLRELMRGPRRELVLLTATPVNNSLYDLYFLVSYFIKQDSRLIKKNIPSIKELFDEANRVDPYNLHPDHLYPLIDATTVKRTRQFIKKHYQDDRIPGPGGILVPITFPKPIPKTVNYNIDQLLPGFFEKFAEALMPESGGEPVLTMARYQVERYLLVPEDDDKETSWVGLLRSNMLKRFESSAHAFHNTCYRMVQQHQIFLESLNLGQVTQKDFYKECSGAEELEDDDFQELLSESENTQPLELYDSERLRKDVENDLALLKEFVEVSGQVKPEEDPKLEALVEELLSIANQAKKDSTTEQEEIDNRKVIIFSYFKDTAVWILERLEKVINQDDRFKSYRGRFIATYGSPDREHVVDAKKASWGFAPRTAAPDNYAHQDNYDILISTDVLAEGVNLQQCRNIINYDLPWNPMRLVQRHGRIDRLLSQHKRVYLRTFFPDKELDNLLGLEQRVRRKLAIAAASVGVSDTPILEGAESDMIFAQTREEIEKIESEETDIFEMGGTDSAAQTGEEYRQILREAINKNFKDELAELPWKIGSGMAKGKYSGYFFCAKIGDQTFLRFVPEGAKNSDEIIDEIGTCLRIIECTEQTEHFLPENSYEHSYQAWALAQEGIWQSWDYYTDNKNLQPKVRKINRESDEFILTYPPNDIDKTKLEKISNTLISPWSLREERKLRDVWKEEFPSNQSKSVALIKAVEDSGIEPYEPPERFPKIEKEEVKLICWLAITATNKNETQLR